MSKIAKIIAVILLLGVILTLSFSAGCFVANRTYSTLDPGLDSVAQAWSIIFDNYVERDKLDAGILSQAAIEGMLEALDDPHTSYMDAETYQLSLSSLEGKFDGIGAYVAVRDEQIMIIAPIADSPAAKAGIRAGDVILAIDGRAASEMSLAEAVLSIRGPKGTSVSLLILHQGETEPEEIEVVRAEIELPNRRYHVVDQPTIPDSEYDRLFERLAGSSQIEEGLPGVGQGDLSGRRFGISGGRLLGGRERLVVLIEGDGDDRLQR